MGFWSTIARLAVRRVDAAECAECPPGLPGQDPAFTTAVTALGAKLAKADGRADAAEFAVFAEVFQPEAGAERDVRRLYNLARQTTQGYESYARRLAKRYRNCPQLLEDVVDGLFHIAAADGVGSPEEFVYLERVSGLFGVSPMVFRRIRATHFGPEADDPYVVLGVAPDVSDAELQAARRRLLAETHPDKVRARGLPHEFVEVFTAKAAAINAAFDAAMAERRQFAGQLA
ncbi:molecular chaperone DjiA [Caulobacter sp. 17J80-11]|uniref:molecular chaperone DjiA n=1 Tax=Caulobacter sp. 17J80-11 TaxID=2763502 RepID=UPI001653C3BC|nr:molecular chaperone DjiA [Caulobacter sp. 17J80-11]MBC6980562.1 molecular chaperone DjiA [Caulobacter sp. 17J80-11]